jgi:hypothetical protein
VSALSGEASLIVAASDLAVVQLIRDAIRTADLSAGQAATSTAPASAAPVTRQTVIEPARTVERQPIIETREVTHYQTKMVGNNTSSCPCPHESSGHRDHRPIYCVIQPPWSVLPWENPAPIKRTVKLQVVRPDILSKGTMIDSFI